MNTPFLDNWNKKGFSMRFLTVALIFAITSTSALAEDSEWEYIVSSNKEDAYMKTVAVKVNDDFYNSVNAWVKYIDKLNGSYEIANTQYYCKSNSFKKLESHKYDKSGNYVSGYTKSADVQRAIPDTIGVDLTEAACISGALSELLRYYYIDNGDITDDHYKKIISSFGEHSMPAMLYYNEKTGNTN